MEGEMSRVGYAPIEIPEGVKVEISGHTITVSGPRGTLTRSVHPSVKVTIENGRILLNRVSNERRHRALHGLARSLVANMVKGVSVGFEKALEIWGIGYRAQVTGEGLQLLVGYSNPVIIPGTEGIEFHAEQVRAVEKELTTRIVVRGIDKERVGEIAAKIRAVRSAEPYKGKGIRYQGEYIRRKAGKTGI
jgi:large subunit ribosomal protein L6